jgi:hypothetical protein
MIVISIFGGLGNQMFQYACGKALAARLGVELKLDVSFLDDKSKRDNFTVRDYELNVFNIDEKEAGLSEVRKFVPDLWNCSKLDLLKYKLLRFVNGNNYYFEKQKFLFEPRIEQLKDNSYVYGYFQTEKYFSNVKAELMQAFTLKSEPDEHNQRLIAQMSVENAVSIHVRRGDYHNSPFNLLDLAYYQQAIELIKQKVENPKFYIFTNDYDWASQNFDVLDIDKVIVDHNQDKTSFMDMVLMSHCKHNICANSSFSWWGAWLNQYADKIAIAPKHWFKNQEYTAATYDLIPDSWLQI